MATDTRNLPAFLANDADFRAWGSGIAAQLAAVGLVKADDTGQIDWLTVTRPVATNTYAGYEIWRFDDALQATKPVFFKLEYGVSAVVDRPALRITVCTATNGAGTPAGQVGMLRTVIAGASKTAGVVLPSYCSGSPSRLNLCSNADANSSSLALLILVERTKNAAGEETGDGIVTYLASQSFQVIPFAGSVPNAANNNAALPFAGALSSVGLDIMLSPTVAALGKPFFASWMAYAVADIGELAPFQIVHLGGEHTYLPMGETVPGSNVVVNGSTNYSLAMLWE